MKFLNVKFVVKRGFSAFPSKIGFCDLIIVFSIFSPLIFLILISKFSLYFGSQSPKSQIIFFDRNNNVALVNNDTLSIKDNTQSPYSLFYFFRTKNFQNYRNQKISLIQNNRTVLFNIHLKKIRELGVEFKIIEDIKLDSLVKKKILQNIIL